MDRMRIIGRLLFAVPLLAAGLALGAPSPVAAAFACTTTINGGTIKDSVVVPEGAVCVLNNVTVRGGVTVEPFGDFFMSGGEVRGSMVATEPANFTVRIATVRGGVTVTGSLLSFSNNVEVSNTEVRGNVVFADNFTLFLDLERAVVRGSVTVSGNFTFDGTYITQNTIDVNLDCFGNDHAPEAAFGPNTVGGTATGQCAGLV